MRIEGQDGTPAKVDSDGRLETSAVAFSEDHVAALGNDAYVIDIDAIAVNGAEHVFVIKNDDDDPLIVTSMTIWVNSFKTDSIMEVNLNESFTYAANGTALTPVNVTSGKVGGAECTVYKITAAGTDITTFSGTATKGGRFLFNTTPTKWAKESGWIVPKNQVFSLYHDGAGTGQTFKGYVSFYFHRSCDSKLNST